MDRSDVINLLKVTQTQDDYGQWVETVEKKQVFCQVERMEELALTAPQTVLLLRELDPTLDLQALSVEECADQILKYLGA